MSFEKLLNEIISKANISKEELIELIKQKQKELQIISFEGAAYLVAKDLGIDLVEYKPRRLEMKNIVKGMRNVNVIGKVFKISSIVEFERNGKKGKVVNIFISDGTDYVRIPLWNEQVKIVEDGEIKVGDTIQIIGGIAKENVFGEKEIGLRKLGRIAPAEEDLDISIEELQKRFFSPNYQRVEIKDIKQGNFEVLAKIVYLFKGNFIFFVCPVCNVTIKEVNGKGVCEEHGEVDAEPNLVITCIIDDGTSNLRAVFFRDVAEKIAEISAKELKEMDLDKRYDYLSQKLLGREFLFKGRVKVNKISERLEMFVEDFKEIDYLEESEKILKELESNSPELYSP